MAYNPAAGTNLNAGNGQSLSVTFTPTDTANYNGASKSVSINVLKATPVLSWSPVAIIVGNGLGASQLNATANVPGAFTYDPAAGTIMNTIGTTTLHTSFVPT